MDTAEGPRPKLHDFLADQGLDHYAGADLIGCSGEYVRRLCLPYANPRRCKPSLRMRQRIERATAGAVAEADWQVPKREGDFTRQVSA